MTGLSLKDATGHEFRLSGAASNQADPLEVSFRLLDSLPAGSYTASWRTSASDGHPSSGSFTFVVLEIAVPPAVVAPNIDTTSRADSVSEVVIPTEAPDASTPGHSLLRAGSFVAVLSLIGAVAFSLVVLPGATKVNPALRQAMQTRAAILGIAAAAVLILTALAHLRLVSGMMNSMGSGHSMTSTELAMHTQWGNALRLQIVAAIVGLIGLGASVRGIRWGWLVAAIATLTISVTPALSGHAGAAAKFSPLMIANDCLHVLAGGIWLGSLLCILTIGIPIALRSQEANPWLGVGSLVNVFSPIALAAASVIVVSGVFASWVHLEHFAALWQTRYGQMLLRKLFFVAIVIGIGAYNYKRVRPQLTHEHGARRLKRSAVLELSAAVAVLIFTGFLTGIEP